MKFKNGLGTCFPELGIWVLSKIALSEIPNEGEESIFSLQAVTTCPTPYTRVEGDCRALRGRVIHSPLATKIW